MKQVFYSIVEIAKAQDLPLPQLLAAYPHIRDLSLDCGGKTPVEKAAEALVYLCKGEEGYSGFVIAIHGICYYLAKKRIRLDYETFLPALKHALEQDRSVPEIETLINENTI